MFVCLVMLEFIYNWGDSVDIVDYYSGNSELKGFGYIGFYVFDVEVVCECFSEMGVLF